MEHCKSTPASFSENASLHLLGTSWSEGFYSEYALSTPIDVESTHVPVKRRKIEENLCLNETEFSNYSIGSRPLSDVFESSYNFLMAEDIMNTYNTLDLLKPDISESQARPALIDFKKRFKELFEWIVQIQKRADRDKTGCCRSENLLEHDFYQELWQRRDDFEALIKFAHELKEKEPDMKTELVTYISDLEYLWKTTEAQCKSPSFMENPAPVLKDIAEDIKEVQKWLIQTQSEFPQVQQWRMTIASFTPAETQETLKFLTTRQNTIEKYSRIINTVIKLIEKIDESNPLASNSNQSNREELQDSSPVDWTEIFDRVSELQHLAQRLRRDCNQVWLHSLELICCLDDVTRYPHHLTQGNRQFVCDQVNGLDSSSRLVCPDSLTVTRALKAHHFVDNNIAFSSSLGKESGFESEISPAPLMSHCIDRLHTDREEKLKKKAPSSSQATSQEGSLDILPFSEDEYEKILATSREDIFSCDDLSSLEGKTSDKHHRLTSKLQNSSTLTNYCKTKMRTKAEPSLDTDVKAEFDNDMAPEIEEMTPPERCHTNLVTCSESNLAILRAHFEERSFYQMNGPHSMDFTYLSRPSCDNIDSSDTSPKYRPMRRLSRPTSRFYKMTAVDNELSDTKGPTSDSEDYSEGKPDEKGGFHNKENEHDSLAMKFGGEVLNGSDDENLPCRSDPLGTEDQSPTAFISRSFTKYSNTSKKRNNGRKRRYESLRGDGGVIVRTRDARIPQSRSTLERFGQKSDDYTSGDNWSCPSATDDESADWKKLVENLTVDNSNRNNQLFPSSTANLDVFDNDSADNSSRERFLNGTRSNQPTFTAGLSASDALNKKSYVQAAEKAEALLQTNRQSSEETTSIFTAVNDSTVEQLGWDNYQAPLYDPAHLNDYDEEACLPFQWDEHMDDSLTESFLQFRRSRVSPCGAENPEERESDASPFASYANITQHGKQGFDPNVEWQEDMAHVMEKNRVKAKNLLADRKLLSPVLNRSKKQLRRCNKTLDRRVPVGEVHDILSEVGKLQDLSSQSVSSLAKLVSLKQAFEEDYDPHRPGSATGSDHQQIISLINGWEGLHGTLQKKLSSARSLAAIYAQANTIKREVEHVSQLLDATSTNQLRDKNELDKHARSLKHYEEVMQDWIGEINHLTDEVTSLPLDSTHLHVDPGSCYADRLNDLKLKVQSLTAKSRSLLMKFDNVSQRCEKIQELCRECDTILTQCRHDLAYCRQNTSEIFEDPGPAIENLEHLQCNLIDCEIRLSTARNIHRQTSGSLSEAYEDATAQQLGILLTESQNISKDCSELMHQLKKKEKELSSPGAISSSVCQESHPTTRQLHIRGSSNHSNATLYYFLVGIVGVILAGFAYIIMRAKLIIHPQISYDKPPPI